MLLDEKYEGPGGRRVTMRWFELARLYQAWEKYESSREAYETAIPLAEKHGLEKDDPIGLATVLDDYSIVLKNCNQGSAAEMASVRAKKLKEANPSITSKSTFRYYPKNVLMKSSKRSVP